MTRQSAGLLMYRRREVGLEVFLVHPGGPFWAKKDEGAWSIPKGEFSAPENPLQAARREFEEETGVTPEGVFLPLKPVQQPGGKWVWAWAVEGDLNPDTIQSNTFKMEWPPRSGKQQIFPEIDRAAWFCIDEARKKILSGQLGLLDELVGLVTTSEGDV